MRYRYQLTVAALAVLAGCVQEPPPPPEISAADLVPPAARHEVGIKEKTVAAEERKALEITEKVIQNSSINSPVSTECFCTNCGNPVVPHAKFCPKCGAKNKDEANWLLG